MKIVAKKCTPFEQCIKETVEKIKNVREQAYDLVERRAGVRPIISSHTLHWGIIIKLEPEFLFHPDEEPKIDKTVLRPIAGSGYLWIPNLRRKAGKQFRDDYKKFAEEHKVTDEIFHPFGIHMVDYDRGFSYRIVPYFDDKTCQYMLICSDSIPEAFDKEKLAQDQFYIEY